jgi:hypothetical protein
MMMIHYYARKHLSAIKGWYDRHKASRAVERSLIRHGFVRTGNAPYGDRWEKRS